MAVEKFEEIAKTFDERVRKIVWCTVTTPDTAGRPFSRILHPAWEGKVGYDLNLFWKGGVSDPTFGVLKPTPSRIELWTLADLATGKPPTIWQA